MSKTPVKDRCAAESRSGRCRAWPLEGSRFCFFHDPDNEVERKRACRRGAAIKHGLIATPLAMKCPPGLRSIAELMELIEVILRACISNDVDHRLANTMGVLVRVQAGLIVDYQLEDRVIALEKALEENDGTIEE